jgi:hypothetical protein
MMARPARVDMRWRKPCFLARFRTFGWNVRFTHRLLGWHCQRADRHTRRWRRCAQNHEPLGTRRILDARADLHQAAARRSPQARQGGQNGRWPRCASSPYRSIPEIPTHCEIRRKFSGAMCADSGTITLRRQRRALLGRRRSSGLLVAIRRVGSQAKPVLGTCPSR